jgi:hypothetical protein
MPALSDLAALEQLYRQAFSPIAQLGAGRMAVGMKAYETAVREAMDRRQAEEAMARLRIDIASRESLAKQAEQAAAARQALDIASREKLAEEAAQNARALAEQRQWFEGDLAWRQASEQAALRKVELESQEAVAMRNILAAGRRQELGNISAERIAQIQAESGLGSRREAYARLGIYRHPDESDQEYLDRAEKESQERYQAEVGFLTREAARLQQTITTQQEAYQKQMLPTYEKLASLTDSGYPISDNMGKDGTRALRKARTITENADKTDIELLREIARGYIFYPGHRANKEEQADARSILNTYDARLSVLRGAPAPANSAEGLAINQAQKGLQLIEAHLINLPVKFPVAYGRPGAARAAGEGAGVAAPGAVAPGAAAIGTVPNLPSTAPFATNALAAPGPALTNAVAVPAPSATNALAAPGPALTNAVAVPAPSATNALAAPGPALTNAVAVPAPSAGTPGAGWLDNITTPTPAAPVSMTVLPGGRSPFDYDLSNLNGLNQPFYPGASPIGTAAPTVTNRPPAPLPPRRVRPAAPTNAPPAGVVTPMLPQVPAATPGAYPTNMPVLPAPIAVAPGHGIDQAIRDAAYAAYGLPSPEAGAVFPAALPNVPNLPWPPPAPYEYPPFGSGAYIPLRGWPYQ